MFTPILREDLFNKLDRELSCFFPARTRAASCCDSTLKANWTPAVDVKEEGDKYLVTADVPGVDPKDIEVTFENSVLTISGHRETEEKSTENGYSRVERSYGSFSRKFTLPDTANVEQIAAKSKNGVLEITIPKREQVKPRKIEIS